MPNLWSVGCPRIALLDGLGTKIKTLSLPAPDRADGVTLEWVEKAYDTDLIDGSESCRRLGFIPVLTLKYAAYNDLIRTSALTIGGLDGNMADILSLLSILDTAPGYLKVSPGPTSGGFVVNKTVVAAMGISGPVTTGLQIVLRGGGICPTKVLGAW